MPKDDRARRILTHHAYTIACICPMGIELAPFEAQLDEIHSPLPTARDYNNYTLGRLGTHDVVIVVLPQIGNSAVVAAAVHLLYDFPAIRFGLLLGVGGGVPGHEDVRLGDVVVSQPKGMLGGVVRYDMGKLQQDGFQRSGPVNKPPAILLGSIERLKAQHRREGSRISEIVKEMIATHPSMADYMLPDFATDLLFESSYTHTGGIDCSHCDKTKTVKRHPRRNHHPVVHYGNIGSANMVMKDGMARDKLSSNLNILALEMEAAGCFETLPCLVVRGICDYADSHKNKVWQPYAAAVAAAYVKELLSLIPRRDVTDSKILENRRGIQFDADRERHPASRFAAKKRMRSPTLDTDFEVIDEHCRSNQLPQATPTTLERHDERPHKVSKALPSALSMTSIPSEEERIKDTLQVLRFTEMTFRLDSIKSELASTCRWLLTHETYRLWLNDLQPRQYNGFLWIRGKPASGKSTIMKFILLDFQENRSDRIVVSFFFNARGSDLEKSVQGMYRSLLVQLLERYRDSRITSTIADVQSTVIAAGQSFDGVRLRLALRQMLRKFRGQSITIFIDALDESNEDDVRGMVDHFEDLAEDMIGGDSIKLSICLSSRHYPHISMHRGLEMILEQEDGHRQDIITYLDQRLKGRDGQHLQSIREQVLTRSSGVFLWVVLVVGLLNKAYDRGQIHAMQQKLDETPSDLHTLFEEILTKDQQGLPELQICLKWMLFSTRPLYCRELYHAIRLEASLNGQVMPDTSCMTTEDMYRYILNCSKGLAEMTGNDDSKRIQFIHESVRDFLFFKDGGLERFWLAGSDRCYDFEGKSHDEVKDCCYRYIQGVLKTVDMNMATSKDEKSWQYLGSRYPLLRYAVEAVLRHADSAEKYRISQTLFLNRFDFDEWRELYRFLVDDFCARHIPDKSPIFVFVLLGLDNLLHTMVRDKTSFVYNPYGMDRLGDQFVTYYGMTALILASWLGTTNIVRILLDTDRFSLHTRCARQRTALWWAAYKKREDVVQLLIDRHVGSLSGDEAASRGESYLNLNDENQTPPLIAAVIGGSDRIVTMLLDSGMVDPCVTDRFGRTPLLVAAISGRPRMFRRLLEIGQVSLSDLAGAELVGRVIANSMPVETPLQDYQFQLLLLEYQRERLTMAQNGAEQDPVDIVPRSEKEPCACGPIEQGTACTILTILIDSGKLNQFNSIFRSRTLIESAKHRGLYKVAELLISFGA